MNVREWKKAGYHVLFRGEQVILVNEAAGLVHVTDIDDGGWMKTNDLTAFPWSTRDLSAVYVTSREDIRFTLKYCYCTSDMLCDLCTGLRQLVA